MATFICQRCEAQYETWGGACPACGGTDLLTLAAPVDRMVGRTIANRYRILRRLGQGGMGSVYLAEQVGIGQQVAMKFLNHGLSLDPDVARRFLNEAKSYARVAHPNAVTLHDFGQDDEGTLYISMEYVEGDDLKRVLAATGRLPVHEAADIILQVADVLAYAHARQVIHRDLKPENVMVRQGMRGWHVKVLDFGIARITDGATRLTLQGAVAGTPRYMSPEQAMGLDVDARADIYAVGVVLFELLTGHQPFDGASVGEIMQKQVHHPMPHLKDVVADLDLPGIDAVIQKATAKKRVERYATMEAFATDLNNALPTLTGKRAISGVNPTVKGAIAEESTPNTLLFGDGSEATLVRGEAVPRQDTAGQHGTGRMTPIPLTQPAPPQGTGGVGAMQGAALRVGPDGFDKTAHAVSPYAPPKRSTGMVMALGIAGALLLGGAGVVAIRSTGGGNGQAVMPPAPSAPAVVAPAAPAQPEVQAKAPEAPTPVEAPTPAPEVQAVAPAAAQDVATKQLQVLAKGQVIDIGNDFNDGKLDSALQRLEQARSLGLESVEPELASLGQKLEDASKRLGKAHRLREDGDCEAALRVYRALLKDYPKLSDARHGITRCERESLPETID
ncbi:serine/threonine-protein kinase [Pyxidicoccus xibeiensis]|uniref:serine/threonine-protein kinase n=1 Tax=Pyxidicoccus xibeiensis TaxID=2906759 RepID=UPI0020A804F7|nr:serine/threonine-protein kinase [Pyxidicoccus xibeiensis]MCP3145227.1 serine/threonine protein kinase [Pyxidicoccus xibeiensis]